LQVILYPKPETRNPKPETRNPKPETRNPKLFTEQKEAWREGSSCSRATLKLSSWCLGCKSRVELRVEGGVWRGRVILLQGDLEALQLSNGEGIC